MTTENTSNHRDSRRRRGTGRERRAGEGPLEEGCQPRRRARPRARKAPRAASRRPPSPRKRPRRRRPPKRPKGAKAKESAGPREGQQDRPGRCDAPAQERRHPGRDHGQDGLAETHRPGFMAGAMKKAGLPSSPSNRRAASAPTGSTSSIDAPLPGPPGSGRGGLFCFKRLLPKLVLPLAQPALPFTLLERAAFVRAVAQHGLLARQGLPALPTLTSTYFGSSSMPTQTRSVSSAAASVVPLPGTGRRPARRA
jgi:hypothetical protein